MKKIILSIITLTAIVGCEDPNEGSLFVQPTNIESEMSMTSILEKSPETYSMWIDLLKYADFYNAMKDANANATVFCPTNDAIRKFLADRDMTSVNELNREYARRLVQNHIIDWQRNSNQLNDSALIILARDNGYIKAQNLFNKYLNVSYGYTNTNVDDDRYTGEVLSPDSIFINNHAKLGRFVSTSCSNGAVYMMDDVIIPNAENIVEKLEILEGENNTFRIFADAIKADKEMYKIATLERDTTIGIGGRPVVNSYFNTCFAVPDHIMNKAGITDVESLKRWLVDNSNGDEVNADTALNHYLKYHFMPTQYSMSQIFNIKDEDETLIYDTRFKGQAFIANLTAGKRIINTDIPVLRSDIEASNGLITKVGGVMPVYHPVPVNVKWDFLNSADIISFVNKWSTEEKNGNIFTSPLQSKEYLIDLANEANADYGTITSFTGNYTKSSSNYHTVGFVKEKYVNNKNTETPFHSAYLNNYMILNLGFAGWVEFTTPTIIAGKYKVVLHYIKDQSQATMFSSGTIAQFNIDGEANQSLVYLYRGVQFFPIPPISAEEETLWSTVDFTESKPHQFKITMRDVSAKNDKNYHLRLDYVEFIPQN